jgi:hypothetical protein
MKDHFTCQKLAGDEIQHFGSAPVNGGNSNHDAISMLALGRKCTSNRHLDEGGTRVRNERNMGNRPFTGCRNHTNRTKRIDGIQFHCHTDRENLGNLFDRIDAVANQGF